MGINEPELEITQGDEPHLQGRADGFTPVGRV
jgi:hypothetical protein